MRITYDASADAAYFYLSDGAKSIETRQIDEDINIDFNERDQMVGIEVLGASERLPLSEIWQSMENLDTDWLALTEALESKRARNMPITASEKGRKAWIEDVGYAHVVFKDEAGGLRKVHAYQLPGSQSGDPLIETLRKMGNYDKNSVIQ